MAAKILPFPDNFQPDLVKVEQNIRDTLVQLTGDDDLVDSVTDRMMTFIRNYACKYFEPSFNLPMPPMTAEQRIVFSRALEAGVDGIAEQIYDMVNKIIKERLLREIEVYQSGNPLALGRVAAIIEALPEGRRERINFLVGQLKTTGLQPREKYLLNQLLASVLENKPACGYDDTVYIGH